MDDLHEAVQCLKELAREGRLSVPQTQAIWLVLSELDNRKEEAEISHRVDPTSI